MKKYRPLNEAEIRELLYGEKENEDFPKIDSAFEFGPTPPRLRGVRPPKKFVKLTSSAYLSNLFEEYDKAKQQLSKIPGNVSSGIARSRTALTQLEIPLLQALLIFFLVIFITTTGALWPGIGKKLSWWYKTEISPRATEKSAIEIKPHEALPAPKPAQQEYIYPGAKNQLKIEKISAIAPVIWQVSADQVIGQLRSGVVNLAGTGQPADAAGNTAIVGHSSNYTWDPGQYKSIFALLDNLTAGDKIELTDDKHIYIYQVQSKQIVKPSEVSVLDQTNDRLLTLITCVPVGTALNRLVVQAQLIEVDYNPVSQKTT